MSYSVLYHILLSAVNRKEFDLYTSISRTQFYIKVICQTTSIQSQCHFIKHPYNINKTDTLKCFNKELDKCFYQLKL